MCLPHNNSFTRNARTEAFWGVVRDSRGLELSQSLICKIQEKYPNLIHSYQSTPFNSIATKNLFTMY